MAKLRSTLFIVLSPAGIDASPFLSQLRSHPDLLCHGDIHGPLSETGYTALDRGQVTAGQASKELHAFARDFPEAFLYKYLLDSRGRQAVGFAVDHGTLPDSANARLRNVLYHDGDVKLVLHTPQNILRAYVEDARHAAASLFSRAKPVEVEPQKFLLHAKQVDRMSAYVAKFFQAHPQLKVEGENLLHPKAGATLKAVARFLDIALFPSGTPVAKSAQTGLRDMIANFAALEAALSDTPYARMLES